MDAVGTATVPAVLFATLIPPHTSVNGRIETPGDLTIEGRCDGAIHVGGAILVASGAACRATIRAFEAQIYGHVIGDIECTHAIHIGAGARIVGNVRSPEVLVAASAHVEGKVDLLPSAPRSSNAKSTRSAGGSLTFKTSSRAQGNLSRPTKAIPPSPRPRGRLRIVKRISQSDSAQIEDSPSS